MEKSQKSKIGFWALEIIVWAFFIAIAVFGATFWYFIVHSGANGDFAFGCNMFAFFCLAVGIAGIADKSGLIE